MSSLVLVERQQHRRAGERVVVDALGPVGGDALADVSESVDMGTIVGGV